MPAYLLIESEQSSGLGLETAEENQCNYLFALFTGKCVQRLPICSGHVHLCKILSFDRRLLLLAHHPIQALKAKIVQVDKVIAKQHNFFIKLRENKIMEIGFSLATLSDV